MSLLRVVRQHTHVPGLVIVILSVTVLSLLDMAPLRFYSPDVQYVKAKVLYVMNGYLFADPITGVPTFHPPYYHLLLVPLKALGIGWRWILLLIPLLNFSLLVVFTYRIAGDLYGHTTGFFTAMMLPFILQFMGCAQPLLPTAFFFSVTPYLAGLRLYLRPDRTGLRSLWIGLLWGIAYLISPTWLFLIGFTFLYDLFWRRDYRQFGILVGSFLVMMIPFVVQAVFLYEQDLQMARTFQWWHGVPGLGWWRQVAVALIQPTGHAILSLGPLIHILLLGGFVYLSWRERRLHWLVVVSLLAYLFSLYHFNHQYAIRIQVIFSIIVVARVSLSLVTSRIRRVGQAFLLVGAAFGVYDHATVTSGQYDSDQRIGQRVAVREKFTETLRTITEPEDFILATKYTYLNFVMPEVPVHALGAYRTPEYFQVPKDISDQFERAYIYAARTEDPARLQSILDAFAIEIAVFSHLDKNTDFRPLNAIRSNWPVVYADGRTAIYRRPPGELGKTNVIQ